METILKIMELSEKRINHLHNVDNSWFYEWNKTYIEGIKDELKEAENEIREWNSVYLEDELWDIFWDYICLLNSLEQDNLIDKEKVFKRCYKKFSERLSKLDNTKKWDWDRVKIKQKKELSEEHDKKYNKN